MSDPKAPVRAAALTTLTAMADAAGLDALLASFEKPLDSANPMLRKELLAWLENRCKDEDTVVTLDFGPVAGSILGCLEDRTAEVRKSATALLPAIIARSGYNAVMELVSKLKPASKNTVLPLVEAARNQASLVASAPATARAPATANVPSATAKPAPPTVVATAQAAQGATGPALGRLVARPGATGALKTLRTVASSASLPHVDDSSASRLTAAPKPKSSVKSLSSVSRPASSTPASSSSPVVCGGRDPPFTDADPKPKQVRASKETGSLRWIIDGTPRPDQIEALQQQMTAHTSPELLALLFSKDHNAERDYVTALTTLDDCARDADGAAQTFDLAPEELRARLVANVDVVFKYITLRIGLSSTTITVKCLDLIDHTIPVLDAEGYKLSDYETSALLICLIAKVGIRAT